MNEQWQELKETIIELRDNNGTGTQQEVCKFLANLMDVLEKQMQAPCGDAISRQAVLDCQHFIYDETGEELEVIFAENVLNLPSVTPQLKTGHWIRWYEQMELSLGIQYIPHCKCSECGKEYDSHLSQFIKYCNECGAKMLEVEE